MTNFILEPLPKKKMLVTCLDSVVWVDHTTETPRSPLLFRTCRKPFFERALTTMCIFSQDIYRKNPTDIRWRSRHRTSRRHTRTVSVSARAPPVWGCLVQDQTSESSVHTPSLVTCLKNFLKKYLKLFLKLLYPRFIRCFIRYRMHILRVSTK